VIVSPATLTGDKETGDNWDWTEKEFTQVDGEVEEIIEKMF